MSLDKYVIDIETAIKLEEKGFGKKANFFWCYAETWDEGKGFHYDWDFYDEREAILKMGKPTKTIPTYLLAQVLEALPERIPSGLSFNPFIRKVYPRDIRYERARPKKILQAYGIGTEVNDATAAAKLWLWCEEMGHVGGEK